MQIQLYRIVRHVSSRRFFSSVVIIRGDIGTTTTTTATSRLSPTRKCIPNKMYNQMIHNPRSTYRGMGSPTEIRCSSMSIQGLNNSNTVCYTSFSTTTMTTQKPPVVDDKEDCRSQDSTLSPSPSPSISKFLAQCVANGDLHLDREQKRVAKRLSRLQKALDNYDNSILFEPPPLIEEEEKDEQEQEKTTTALGNISLVGKKQEGTTQTTTPRDPTTTTIPTSKLSNDNDTTKEEEEEEDTITKSKSSLSSSPPRPQLQLRPKIQIPRGLYIYGDVGTGKTMLMDYFYSLVNVPRRQRYHFHAFLAKVHSMIHTLKEDDLLTKGRNFSIDTSLENNPIYRVGLQLSKEVPLLCLDEFQVTDIADAVILSQLFSVLFAKGTVIVATSNRPPTDLYEGGMNRGYFLPFIDLLQHHCIVHCINSELDYRTLLSSGVTSFFVASSSSSSSSSSESILEELVQGVIVQLLQGNASPSTMVLDVGFQRSLMVSGVYGDTLTTTMLDDTTEEGPSFASPSPKMARFTFDELCQQDIGAMEYRAIAKQFDIVVLEDIPHLSVSRHNVARRFITLIDELYEGRCALLCSSMAESPKDIFQAQQEQDEDEESTLGTAPNNDIEDDIGEDGGQKDVGDMRDLDLVTTQGGTPIGALASVRELGFAFERASSRLIEMTSERWWKQTLN